MKNKAGTLIGFVIGLAGFLFLFKVTVLENTSPSDELAPGIVVLASIVSGVIFAFAGRSLQTYFARKRT